MADPKVEELFEGLSRTGKMKAALLCELQVTYLMGESKAPKNRMNDYVYKLVEYYSSQFALTAIHALMETSMKHENAPIEIVMMTHERYYNEKCEANLAALINIRHGLIKDFPIKEEDKDARAPHKD
jgi:hypothetical protein